MADGSVRHATVVVSGLKDEGGRITSLIVEGNECPPQACRRIVTGKRGEVSPHGRQHPAAGVDGEAGRFPLLVQPPLVRVHGYDARADGGLELAVCVMTPTNCPRRWRDGRHLLPAASRSEDGVPAPKGRRTDASLSDTNCAAAQRRTGPSATGSGQTPTSPTSGRPRKAAPASGTAAAR